MQIVKLENPHSLFPNLDVMSPSTKLNWSYWFCTLSLVCLVIEPFVLHQKATLQSLPSIWGFAIPSKALKN